MTNATIRMLPAVERFGCCKMSRNIAPGMISGGISPQKLRMRAPLLSSALAMKTTIANFATSEG